LTSYQARSILVLEDDDLTRDVTRNILQAAGFKVICANQFRQAIEHIERGTRFDIALVDVRMPHGTPSGISFVRVAQSRRPSMKVIFMSTHVAAQEQMRFDEGEIFLHKPFAPHHLLTLVERAAA
jgi:DNA-binding NtrC family response regulator